MAQKSRGLARTQLIRLCGYALACVPAAVVGFQTLTGSLGANPIEALLNRLGWWALVVLMASLACTPLRLVTRNNAIAPWRRIFGLAAFWYAFAHLSAYVVLDKFFDLGDIIQDVLKRPFITVGFAAFCVLLALTLSSPAGMVRWLGGRKWRALHRLAYVAGGLGVVHFLWRVKADLRTPLVFAAIWVFMMVVRLAFALHKRVRPAG